MKQQQMLFDGIKPKRINKPRKRVDPLALITFVDGHMIDRREAKSKIDPIVYVKLACGYWLNYWMVDLSDDEYIKRTKFLKEDELTNDNHNKR